jgi:RNA-directed DNA polymerase
MTETKGSEHISTRLQRIATQAREHPDWVLTTLAHHIDVAWLAEAYRRTRKSGAVGIDGVTATEYERNLDSNLIALLERFRSGSYVAPPVRRVWIPKGGGGQRPIGIPTLEDKVLQRAVAMILEAVYEQSFLDCSYGFRPGRSAHDALQALRNWLMGRGGGWVLEIDVQGFFDALDHGHLRSFLDLRVNDGVLRRMIHKWLKAGVMEEGGWHQPEQGTPQGGVVSPILANIYLHEVMDAWFVGEVTPRLRGQSRLIRYADDIVVAFEREDDARRVMEVLPKRLARFGLGLHPQKTRLVRFRRPDGRSEGKPMTFDLLGFTHYWGRTRTGRWVVKHKTARDRLSRALRELATWARRNRHRPLADQHRTLAAKLRGHYGYYGISGNYRWLARFYRGATRLWRKWLGRRSDRADRTWRWFRHLLERLPLPLPTITHRPRLANP